MLTSNCMTPGNGALDVVVVLNHAPQTTDLRIDSSKFGANCECLAAEVTAGDPDGDDVMYTWEVVSVPEGAITPSTTSAEYVLFHRADARQR